MHHDGMKRKVETITGNEAQVFRRDRRGQKEEKTDTIFLCEDDVEGIITQVTNDVCGRWTMSKVLKMIAILFIVIVLWITGGILMNRDKKPLHEQIAEYMFNSYAVPKLEYCVEKYGDEFILTDTGDVVSTRFPGLQVYLR